MLLIVSQDKVQVIRLQSIELKFPVLSADFQEENWKDFNLAFKD